jgi:TonB family protein
MTISRSGRLICFGLLLLATATPAVAQETLARAKDYYASASYEEALLVLNALRTKDPADDATEVSAYQVFCLVALGRSDEARQSIEAIVRNNPLYRPTETQASPRVRQFYESVRGPLLPEILRQEYGRAKDAFDHKEMASAAKGFDLALALIEEIGAADPSVGDMRTLATGFRDLSKAAVAAAAPPPAPPPAAAPVVEAPVPAAPPPPATPPADDPNKVYASGDLGVKEPVSLARPMPPWHPTAIEALQDYRGALELIVDQDGKVTSVRLLDSVHPAYDPQLIKAAADWKFRPATKNGKPVKYRYILDVHLSRQPH